ncbi:MAG: hypothetical protein ACFE0J_13210 [Elainellaceae cyanobacterium]
MLSAHLQRFLTTPVYKLRDPRLTFWLSLSLVFAVVYSLIGLQAPFSSAYVIHDDVRSHVFWMWRFFDPALFPNDLIADYFQSVAPAGYTTLYRIAAVLGIDPIAFNKILPLPLVLITTVYCFGLCMEILAVPAAGFLATVFLNQTIWAVNDVASATPRAFLYPLLMAFLYYVAKRSLLPCLMAIALQGLFYPQTLFISSGVLVVRMIRWQNGLRVSRDPKDYWFCAAGLGVAAVLLLPYALKISEYGPVTSLEEARTLITLQHTGRKDFFNPNPWEFWLCNDRSAIFPLEWCRNPFPLHGWAALLLVPMLTMPHRVPLVRQISENVALLLHLAIASVGMYAIAHGLLFRLHLPNRYTKHSFRMIIAVAGAIALIGLLDVIFRWASNRRAKSSTRQVAAIGASILLVGILFSYPWLLRRFPSGDYVVAEPPELFDFFAAQPTDTLVASLSDQANNIPALSKRSILASSEIANPYHFGYYQQIWERQLDLVQAQYSADLSETQEMIRKYGIDYFLIDVGAFNPDYIENDRWLREAQPIASDAMARMAQGIKPALQTLMQPCSVLKVNGMVVVDAQCVLEAS